MTTQIQTRVDQAQERVDRLVSEYQQLHDAQIALQAEREAFQPGLSRLQADAERGGDCVARDQAELQDQELARAIQRKTAALQAIAADLEQARADLAAAERDAWFDELQRCRARAGELCDQIDRDMWDTAALAELENLYEQHTRLLPQIYGKDALSRGVLKPPGDPVVGQYWECTPRQAYVARLDARVRAMLGLALINIMTPSPANTIPPVPGSMREAMRL